MDKYGWPEERFGVSALLTTVKFNRERSWEGEVSRSVESTGGEGVVANDLVLGRSHKVWKSGHAADGTWLLQSKLFTQPLRSSARHLSSSNSPRHYADLIIQCTQGLKTTPCSIHPKSLVAVITVGTSRVFASTRTDDIPPNEKVNFKVQLQGWLEVPCSG